MGILDRFRKPAKYILQIRAGRGFQNVVEYTPEELRGAKPTMAIFMDDVEEGVYHRLIAAYAGGGIRILDEVPGRKRGRPPKAKETTKDDVEKYFDKALEPLDTLGDILQKVDSIRGKIMGGGPENPDDVSEIIAEEVGRQIGGMGGSFTMPSAPGWLWLFHPMVRIGMRETMEGIADAAERVVSTAVEKAMTTQGAEVQDVGEQLVDPFALLNQELASLPEEEEEVEEEEEEEEEVEP